MSQPKTLIFAGAHPDDETFGMGATLAKYAAAGVQVYYVCATRGEAGAADPEFMLGYSSPAEMRTAELNAAAKVLGLAGVIHLGYRDSGMPGTADNTNPKSLMMAPKEEVVERLVKVIRDLKPQVVVTHDPSGGYQHPDHIKVHELVTEAFFAAGNPQKYTEAGTAFIPQKLYYGVRSNRRMKLMIKLMPLFGLDPHKFGRNKDIDLTEIVKAEYPIHAAVRLSRKDMKTRQIAAACHASQGGGRPPVQGRGLMGILNFILNVGNAISGHRDYFMRAYPPPDRKRRESDLFEGVD